ncbi:hypothetical protein [Streptomyces sp. GbtcB7]|uniref:hypothetical protein n=1 Tax=Streptomyces sp. GbtcB7 TaxID=2824752 RepID=UPI001C30D21A|nr:hypothetical protein [Streptomyces sp. GbtcB7]
MDWPRIRPISSNGTAHRSYNMNATRSPGPSNSRTTRSASPDLEEQLADGTWRPADEHETSHTGLETTLVEIHGVRPGVRRR